MGLSSQYIYSLLVVSVSMVLLLPATQALFCYGCNTENSNNCGVNFNGNASDVSINQCDGGACRTEKVTDKDGVTEIHRSCVAWTIDNEDVNKCAGVLNVENCEYTCRTDLCNDHLNFNREGQTATTATTQPHHEQTSVHTHNGSNRVTGIIVAMLVITINALMKFITH